MRFNIEDEKMENFVGENNFSIEFRDDLIIVILDEFNEEYHFENVGENQIEYVAVKIDDQISEGSDIDINAVPIEIINLIQEISGRELII